MPTVVILLSDKRSGSTMLQEAMCRHPDVRHVAYSPHTYFETHHWLKSAVLLDKPASLFANGQVYDGYGSRKNARLYIEDTLKGNLPDYAPPEDDRALCFEGWEALCDACAAPVFFEKSPQILAQWAALSLLLEWAGTTRHEVKFIGLVRNPLAVQYSAHKLFTTDPQARQFGWVSAQRNLLAFQALVGAQAMQTFRYEDIISDPETSISRMCAHIGIQPHPDMTSEISAGSLTKWRDDPAFSLQLDPSVRQMAEALGYAADELDNPTVDEGRAQSDQSGLRLRLNRVRDRVIRPAYLGLRRVFQR